MYIVLEGVSIASNTNTAIQFVVEFIKLNSHLKLDSLIAKFVVDYNLYKGRDDDSLLRIQQDESVHILARNVRMAGILYTKKNFTVTTTLKKPLNL